jgi:hypothetical protein
MISEHKIECKVSILSNSHARVIAQRLKVTLKDNFEVIGYTNTNCNVQTLIGSAHENITNFSKDDVSIFLGRSNDICHNKIGRSLSHFSVCK